MKIAAGGPRTEPRPLRSVGSAPAAPGGAALAMGAFYTKDVCKDDKTSVPTDIQRLCQSRGFTRKSHTFLPKIFRKMSTQSSKERSENLQFPFLDDDATISTVKESKTVFIIRGLPGSGKSTLAQAIQEQYKDACKVISADKYKIIPAIRSSIPEDYSKLDEDLVDYCKRDISVVVVDDTHHERERLDQLFDIADKYQYKVLFVEPKTPWKMDCLQLKDKNQWKLSVEDLKKMKPSLEKDFLPLYYGWFLSKKSSENLRKTGQAFLDELGSLKAFKKESKHFTPSEDPKGKIDLTNHFVKRPPSVLHCTTKFTDFGKAMGADEYAQQEVVKASYGKAFTLTISALFLTTKTAGARVELSEQELLLWPGDVDKILPTDNLPKGSRAHITLGCASGIEPVQTGMDLLEFVKLEKAGNKGDEIEAVGGGKLLYFGNGMWMLLLAKKIEVKAVFSGYYGKGKLVPTQGSNKRGSAFNSCTII